MEKKAKSWTREIQKGYLKLLILMLLAQKPLHGYEIINQIEEKTLGFWRPTAGGIYPVLRRMEKSGLVNSRWAKVGEKHRRIYEITVKGKEFVNRALEKQKVIFDTIEKLYSDFVSEFLDIPPTKIPRFPFLVDLLSYREKSLTVEQKIERLKRIESHLKEALKTVKKYLKLVDKRLKELQKQGKQQK